MNMEALQLQVMTWNSTAQEASMTWTCPNLFPGMCLPLARKQRVEHGSQFAGVAATVAIP
jgi:hypothetical protein